MVGSGGWVSRTSDREPAGHARGPIPNGAPGGLSMICDDDDDDDDTTASSFAPPERSISHSQVRPTTAKISALFWAIKACCAGVRAFTNTKPPDAFLLFDGNVLISAMVLLLLVVVVLVVLLDLTVLK